MFIKRKMADCANASVELFDFLPSESNATTTPVHSEPS